MNVTKEISELRCSDCGALCPDWECYERRGQLFCGRCLLKTAERRAYEEWFVRG